jgi:hypothetical protein
MGSDDMVDVVANKVLADYFAAKKIIAEYGQSFVPKKGRNKNWEVAIAK